MSPNLYSTIHPADDTTAFVYFNIPFSYSRLHSEIDKAAKAFTAIGIKKGDVVTSILPTIPETIFCTYSLNKIGAVTNFIDIRYTPEQVKEKLCLIHSKVIIVMAFYLKEIQKIQKDLDIDKIIVLRGCDSLPSFIPFWYKLGECFNGRRRIMKSSTKYITWPDFIKKGTNCNPDIDVEVNGDDNCLIFQTSGTTGHAKSVVQTNNNIVNAVISTANILSEQPHEKEKVLSVIPAFTCFGFCNTVHLPLMYGMSIIIIPLFHAKEFPDLISKYKPNHLFGVPHHWDFCIKQEKDLPDFSCIKNVCICGDLVNKKLYDQIEGCLLAGGCKVPLTILYAMTESALISVYRNKPEESYTAGNVGKPIPGIEICIYDNVTNTLMEQEEVGEICVQTSLKLKEYYKNPDATQQLVRVHKDGKEWLHTGDLGYLSKNGNLIVAGRSKRMIVRYDGTKIFPIEIEDVINGCGGIKECKVVSMKDHEHPFASLPCAIIVPDGSQDDHHLINSIREECTKKLPVYLQPSNVISVKEIPKSPMGKVDYKKLIQIIGDDTLF